jgi:ERCC4-type nuclease
MVECFIDSNEPEEIIQTFDLMRVDYQKKELKFQVCQGCNKIYVYGEEPQHCCDEEEYETVKAGDIIGGNYNYVIEIKRGMDLVNSLNENHIYDQMERMVGVFRNNVILCFVGRFEDLLLDEHGSKRAGQLLSIPATCAQYGISFIQVNHMSTLIRMLKYFNEKCGEEPKIRNKFFRRADALPKAVRILMGIQGIGEELSNNIYQKYPSVKEVVIALEMDSFGGVPKVGPKKTKDLYEWLMTSG